MWVYAKTDDVLSRVSTKAGPEPEAAQRPSTRCGKETY